MTGVAELVRGSYPRRDAAMMRAASEILEAIRVAIDRSTGQLFLTLDDGEGEVIAAREITEEAIEAVTELLLSRRDEAHPGAAIDMTNRETGEQVTLGVVVHDRALAVLERPEGGSWN